MKRMAMAIGLAAAMTLTAATVFAGWGGGMGRGNGPGHGPGYGAGQGPGCGVAQTAPALSAEQAAKVQKIQSERYAEAAKVRGEMTAKRIELQGLYRAPELDKAKIAAKQKEFSELQARNREKAQASRLAFLEVLTPEQRAQLPAQGFGHGRGRGMGPGGRW